MKYLIAFVIGILSTSICHYFKTSEYTAGIVSGTNMAWFIRFYDYLNTKRK